MPGDLNYSLKHDLSLGGRGFQPPSSNSCLHSLKSYRKVSLTPFHRVQGADAQKENCLHMHGSGLSGHSSFSSKSSDIWLFWDWGVAKYNFPDIGGEAGATDLFFVCRWKRWGKMTLLLSSLSELCLCFGAGVGRCHGCVHHHLFACSWVGRERQGSATPLHTWSSPLLSLLFSHLCMGLFLKTNQKCPAYISKMLTATPTKEMALKGRGGMELPLSTQLQAEYLLPLSFWHHLKEKVVASTFSLLFLLTLRE